MPRITIANRQIQVDSQQSLLDSLLESGERIPFSCRSGVCHACLLKADHGLPPPNSQQPLDRKHIENDLFLACQCFPVSDLTVSLPERTTISGIISVIEKPDPTLIVLAVTPRHPVEFRPGQHLTIRANKRLIKDCYLASSPVDPILAFYIRRKTGDPFSTWAHEIARVGHTIFLERPCGLGIRSGAAERKSQLIFCHENHLAPAVAIIKDHCYRGQTDNIHFACFYDGYQPPKVIHFLQDMADQHAFLTFAFHSMTTLRSRHPLYEHLRYYQLIISGAKSFIAAIEQSGYPCQPSLKFLPLKEHPPLR